jgi:hypothetical protein
MHEVCDGNHGGPPCSDPACWNDAGQQEPRRLVAHGFTFVGWAMSYESALPANDTKAVWNEAMNRSHTEETQVFETRQRLLRVHEVGERCLFCDIASGKTGKVPEAAEENSGLV